LKHQKQYLIFKNSFSIPKDFKFLYIFSANTHFNISLTIDRFSLTQFCEAFSQFWGIIFSNLNFKTMKKYVLILGVFIAFLSFNFTNVTEKYGARFAWAVDSHDFGKIPKDQPVTAKFSFENTGDQPLMILSAIGSCGCTVADFTKGEILPGEKGEVTATYNAAKAGVFNKTITVNANTGESTIVLTVKGEVIE